MQETIAADNSIYRKRYTSSIAWAVGVLLFLLPFIEIRCNGAAFAQNTGLGLAIGSDLKVSNGLSAFGEQFDTGAANKSKATTGSGKVYYPALIALVLGAIGLGISLVKVRPGVVNTVIGGLAVAAMIFMFIQVKADVSDQMKKTDTGGTGMEGFGKDVKITVDFTPWYYLSVVSFLAATFFNYKNSQPVAAVTYKETPPAHAPQVPIQNPGDQSNFPAAPSESEIG